MGWGNEVSESAEDVDWFSDEMVRETSTSDVGSLWEMKYSADSISRQPTSRNQTFLSTSSGASGASEREDLERLASVDGDTVEETLYKDMFKSAQDWEMLQGSQTRSKSMPLIHAPKSLVRPYYSSEPLAFPFENGFMADLERHSTNATDSSAKPQISLKEIGRNLRNGTELIGQPNVPT